METYLIFALVLLTVLLVILAVKILAMRKSAKEIANGLERILAEDTNEQITISSGDKKMCFLACAVNNRLRILRKERLRYEKGDRELKQAITDISHDLRTPLTAILGYAQMAQKEENAEKTKEYLAVIESRAQKMKEMTDELFTYALITAPNKELTVTKTDIRSVLEDSLAENYWLLTKNNIEPQIQISQKPVIKLVDGAALQRVFSNILSNAAKYSDGNLKIALKESGEITFANSAAGISRVEAGRLFDRFFTVENGQNATGLGLSIAKSLTEKMGGKITADYADNKLIITLVF